jgi:hypothetical protein
MAIVRATSVAVFPTMRNTEPAARWRLEAVNAIGNAAL